MNERHRARRLAFGRIRVASRRLWLQDPLFNLREVCKQLLLLEDHLFHKEKQCPDCIRKHLLMIEALADEAVALDPIGLYVQTGCINSEMARTWAEQLCDGRDPTNVADQVRAWRKRMTPMVFDPRSKEAVARVAAAYVHRVMELN
jgi:hypothetical protein